MVVITCHSLYPLSALPIGKGVSFHTSFVMSYGNTTYFGE